LSQPFAALELRRLPSTSPANASIRLDSKLELWRGALAQVASQQHRDAKRSARS
jgi:G:T/U-mismatch repair DNA glycosylase